MDDHGTAEELRARLFGFVQAGAEEEDLPSFAAAIDAYRDAVLATLPSAALRSAADRLDADMERFFAEWPDEPRNSPYALGRKDAVTELRRWANEASGVQQPAANTPDTGVVAYRSPDRPDALLCREHGEGWLGLIPLTSEDLPDGGFCTWGGEYGHDCGRDVLITSAR